MHSYLFQIRSAAAATAVELMPVLAAMMQQAPAYANAPLEIRAGFFLQLRDLEDALDTVELLLGQGGAA